MSKKYHSSQCTRSTKITLFFLLNHCLLFAFLRIIVLVIFILACDVPCKAHNRWPYGYDRDDEGYKVIPGFVGENCVTEDYGGDDVGRGARMEEEAMGGGGGYDGEIIMIIDSTKYLGY